MKKIFYTLLMVLGILPVYAAKENMNNVYGVVLAGGIGERLWPYSRQTNPKQFLPVGSEKSLLEQAINRLMGILPQEQLWGVTSELHSEKFKDITRETLGKIIIEPASRNTGPAVLLSCLELYEKDPNAIVIFVPADPYIPEGDYALFQRYVQQAIAFASEHDAIILCGVRPTFPATGYGYIEYVSESEEAPFFSVSRFHEKPSLALAKNYIQQSNMLWNICMFVGKVSVFINEFKHTASDLYQEMLAYKNGECSYNDILSISVDCAVIEKSNNIWVLPVDFSWCDVGNVSILMALKEKVSTSGTPVISIDSHNNLVDVKDKLVALVGVDDLCIVETADALLISRKDEAEKVRSVVAQLKENKQVEYL